MLFCFFQSERLSFPDQSDIQLECYRGPAKSRLVFFAPHENEHVAESYIKAAIQGKRAHFFILRQAGERELELKFPEGTVKVDPNRIFTPAGSAASILKTNPDLTTDSPLYKQAFTRCNRLGYWLTQNMGLFKRKTVIIAVHNNTDGFDDDGKGGEGTISMVRYQKRFEAGAKYIRRIFIGPGDEDDLIFLTHWRDYRYFKKRKFSIVQQHKQVGHLPDEDDGSLSVWAEKFHRRYLNLEAQRDPDHLEVQQKMVDTVLKRFL